jgi:hypothetical protein
MHYFKSFNIGPDISFEKNQFPLLEVKITMFFSSELCRYFFGVSFSTALHSMLYIKYSIFLNTIKKSFPYQYLNYIYFATHLFHFKVIV